MYKDGFLNGKGKKYDENGKIIFEGEYKNGKEWEGKAKGENFKGEYLNGQRWNGKGKEYKNIYVGPGCTDFKDILVFEGEYMNGIKKGKRYIYDYDLERAIEKEYDEEKEFKESIPDEL